MKNLRFRVRLMIGGLLLIVLSVTSACGGGETEPLNSTAAAQDQAAELSSPVPATAVSSQALPSPEPARKTETEAPLLTAAILLCQDETGNHLFHFDDGRQTWNKHSPDFLTAPDFISQGLLPLGNDPDGHVFIYGVRVAEDATSRFQAYVWQDGSARQVLDKAETYAIIPQLSQHTAQSTTLYAARADEPGAVYQLDINQCMSGACDFMAVDNLVFTSPQNDQSLVWHTENWTLQLADAAGQAGSEIDTGWAPFWLDEATAGYLRTTVRQANPAEAQAALALKQTDSPAEARILFEPEQAKDLLIEQGAIDPSAEIILMNVKGSPTHSDIILVSALDLNAPDHMFLFAVQRQTGEARYIPEIDGLALAELELAPGGDFLVAQTAAELLLYQLASGEIIRYPLEHVSDDVNVKGYAFSADGERLLLPAGATTYVAQPGSGTIEEINLAGQYCTIGTWLQ